MITTVTLNPSLDRTLLVAELTRGEVLRADATRDDPGGKGVNVARALAMHGEHPVAVLPAGGSIGRALVAQLGDAGVDVEPVAIEGTTRANITIVEPDGVTTKLNEPGPLLSATEIDAVIEAVSKRASEGGWVVIGGSLPPGVEVDVITLVVEAAHTAGAKVALDTSGQALRTGLRAKPDLVKPNIQELLEVVGGAASTIGDVVDACQRLRTLGAVDVLCSLGADGAVLVTDQAVWQAAAPPVEVRNTVGAGDALLAGYLFAAGGGPKQALRVGVAWAAAAVRTPGTGVPVPEFIDVAGVHVTDVPDISQSLTEELV
ncbi:MAG TPA: 1-phosphofructokinase [Actinomycetes bacterium]|nr:1-phosphofructokinase [Actinomycetes bacterium]